MTDDQDARQAIATDLQNCLTDAAGFAREGTKAAREALALMAPDVDTYKMGTVNIVARAAAELAQQTEVLLDAARRAHREFSLELMVFDGPPEEEDPDGL